MVGEQAAGNAAGTLISTTAINSLKTICRPGWDSGLQYSRQLKRSWLSSIAAVLVIGSYSAQALWRRQNRVNRVETTPAARMAAINA